MIITAGDLITDVLAVVPGDFAYGSDTPATVTIAGGGQAANVAAWLASIGAAVTFAGAVGADQAGRDRIAELHAAGVDTEVAVHDGVTTGSIIVLVHGSERSMITDRGANLRFDAASVGLAARRPGARHLHLSGYTLLDDDSRPAGLRALETAREAGLTTSVDAASAAPLRVVRDAFLTWVHGCDLVLANDVEAEILAGPGSPLDQAATLAQITGGSCVVKLGADGAVWAGQDGHWRAATEPAPEVDVTGAGDAFAAGLLDAWVSGRGVQDALDAGCRMGAVAVGTLGGRPPAGRA
ncbi:MAG TPA: sugar kinase [Jiangellaceae bacterium]